MSSNLDEQAVRDLHRSLLDRWNARDAAGMASLLSPDANLVGFDGSQMNGRAEVSTTLGAIFANHPTAAYISIVRDVRFPALDVAIMRAVVGMVPPGKTDINPDVNAVQSLVAVRADDVWRVELFHNTPAAYHGRPEESAALSEELRRALKTAPIS
jgi:uncharacterized protein (TIGR02246 family)